MTASHRWGSAKPLSLTKETASTLRRGIKAVDLPKTFGDVVKVAWKMRIRYLWIDSLCIYQDSEYDWRSEFTNMGLVYGNSWLNVAAIDSPYCHSGCLYDRDVKLVRPFKLTLTPDDTEYLCIDGDLWVGGIDRAPLSERGWVLQERLLSPRQIDLGELQIY